MNHAFRNSRFSLLPRALAVVVLAVGFAWGLSLFGATRTADLYRLFLWTSLPTGLALLGGFGASWSRGQLIPYLALGGFLLVASSITGAPGQVGYLLLALGWMSLFLARSFASTGKGARFLYHSLIAVGVFETLYGLAQALAGFDYIGEYHRNLGRVATGTLINQNHFAGLLNMTIPLALGALFADREGRRRWEQRPRSESLARAWMLVLMASLMGLAVLLSRSRGGTVAFVLSLTLTAILLRVRRRRHRWGAAAPALLLALVVALGSGVGINGLLSRFGAADRGLADRSVIYWDTLKLIRDHPWGVGPGMYAWRFRPYQSVSGQVWFDYAHNDYLQTAAEWGVGVALAFWLWVFWRFQSLVRIFLSAREPWRQGMALGCSVAIFSILLHSLVDFNLYIPSNWMIFCAILGLGWGLESLHDGVPQQDVEPADWSSSEA